MQRQAMSQVQGQKENQPFFKPLQSSSKQNKNEVLSMNVSNEQMSQERLTGLHAKLHQEAEKIRRWKLQVETELKRKDQQIQEATHRITSQRNNVLELQLQNENLSQKLQGALDNREELSEKFNNNMERIMAVKGFAENLDERFTLCESSCIDFSGLQTDYFEKFEVLQARFTSLRQTAVNRLCEVKSQFSQEKSELEKNEIAQIARIQSLEHDIESLSHQSSEKDELVQSLSDQLNDSKQELCAAQASLNDSNSHLKDLEATSQKLKCDIERVKRELSELQDTKQKTSEDLAMTTKCLEDTQEQKDLCQKKLEEVSNCFEEARHKFDADLKELQGLYQISSERVQILESDLQKSSTFIEELKTSKDMVVLERATLQSNYDQLEEEKASLNETCQNAVKQNELLQSMTSEHDLHLKKTNELVNLHKKSIEELESALSAIQTKLSDSAKDLLDMSTQRDAEERAKLELEQRLTEALSREKEISDTLSELEQKLHSETNEQSDLIGRMEKLRIEKTSMQKELTGNKKEASKISKELEKYKKTEAKLKQQIQDNQNEISDLKDEIKAVETKLENYESTTEEKIQMEISTTSTLKDKLDESSKKIMEFESKWKQSKSDVTNKNKQMKELEREVKALKTRLESKSREFEELGYKSSELEEALEIKEAKVLDVQSEIKSSKSTIASLEKKLTQKTKEADRAKEMESKAKKEKTDATKLFDDQLNAMVATLDQYKKENEKTVELKNKEIVEAKSDRDTETNKKSAAVDKLNNELEKVKQLYELTKQEKEKQDTLLHGEKENLSKLRRELEIKNNEWANMQLELKEAKDDSVKLIEVNKELETLRAAWNTKCAKLEEELASATARSERLEAEMKEPHSRKQLIKMGGGGDAPMELSRKIPATPKVAKPRITNLSTPILKPSRSDYMTPIRSNTRLVAKTPTQSVLLKNKLSNKKRRVAFAGDEDHTDSDSSSSSELMEVEIDTIRNSGNKNGKLTAPQASPRFKVAPSPSLSGRKGTVTPKPVPRNRGLTNPAKSDSTPPKRNVPKPTQMKKTPKSGIKETAETRQFAELYPNADETIAKEKPKPQRQTAFRKTPARAPGKFFKSPPFTSREKKPAEDEEGDLAWFEADAIFGFGSDD